MSDVRTRAKNLLAELPLSKGQRDLYQHGADSMNEETLERVTSKLDNALSRAPGALANVRRWLERRREHSRKRAIVIIKSPAYRERLVKMLTKELEVQALASGADALETLRKSSADVLICDFDLPGMNGLELIQKVRRLSQHHFVMFVRTKSAEEVGQVAAERAAPYPTSESATSLHRAVVSAMAEEERGRAALARE